MVEGEDACMLSSRRMLSDVSLLKEALACFVILGYISCLKRLYNSILSRKAPVLVFKTSGNAFSFYF